MRLFLISLTIIFIWISPAFSDENELKDLKLEVTLTSNKAKPGDSITAQFILTNTGTKVIKACIGMEGPSYDFKDANGPAGGIRSLGADAVCMEEDIFTLNPGEVYKMYQIIKARGRAGFYKITNISLPVLVLSDCESSGCEKQKMKSSSEPSFEVVGE